MAKISMKSVFGNLRRVTVLVVVLAIIGGGLYYFLSSSNGTKKITADFPEAVGLYPGTPVKILGVNVGQITSVTPKPGMVVVTMTYDSTYDLPKNVKAVEVANSLVSDRYIDLGPAYKKGEATMADGATLPMKDTGSPAELDDIYASLNKLSAALGPNGANKGGQQNGALSELIKVGAANLQGNGAAIGNSITQLSKAARTLADGRGNLFQIVANLRKFTGALNNSDATVRKFNIQLAQVSSELAGERGDLGAALHDLAGALDQVHDFVQKNEGRFHSTFDDLSDITGVLVRERSSLNETLAVAPIALANITHSYEPMLGALGTRSNISSLANPTQLCAVLKGGGLLQGTLLGSASDQINSVCQQLLGKLPDGSEIISGGPLAGLLGGGLNSGGTPSFPLGGGLG